VKLFEGRASLTSSVSGGRSLGRDRFAPAGTLLIFIAQIGADEYLLRLVEGSIDDGRTLLKRKLAVTEREAEVLLWVARGKSNRDIAEILDLSPRTVNKHLEQIYAKLGVENRASAAALAVRPIGVANTSLSCACGLRFLPRCRVDHTVNARNGAPEEIRTPDPQIRSLVLYPAELRARLDREKSRPAG
jgi:DNA-binding CsgD family transcriptional regulator